ncbi:MAG: hypothetical protein L0332_30530 [Chloroflexi bacterium]|nr:hypothetical protein [Chloroflexota bacterium]MCI0643417.1 hypothetical protein [Chloroflexota bacterium]MCI0731037.1 hypothetical protein [Chloroflexota bacterium]
MKRALLLLFIAINLPVRLAAQEPNRVGVVVRFDDEHVEMRCVEFSEAQISGYEALDRTGLVVEADSQSLGGAVCRIGDTGCPAGDCFCQCRGGGECTYWSYWQRDEEAWKYAQVGPTTYQISPGSVDGWSWGPGSVNSAIAPPAVSFEEVCAAPVAGATASPLPATNPAGASEPGPAGWLPYLVFALILAGLVVVLVARRRRSAAE